MALRDVALLTQVPKLQELELGTIGIAKAFELAKCISAGLKLKYLSFELLASIDADGAIGFNPSREEIAQFQRALLFSVETSWIRLKPNGKHVRCFTPTAKTRDLLQLLQSPYKNDKPAQFEAGHLNDAALAWLEGYTQLEARKHDLDAKDEKALTATPEALAECQGDMAASFEFMADILAPAVFWCSAPDVQELMGRTTVCNLCLFAASAYLSCVSQARAYIQRSFHEACTTLTLPCVFLLGCVISLRQCV